MIYICGVQASKIDLAKSTYTIETHRLLSISKGYFRLFSSFRTFDFPPFELDLIVYLRFPRPSLCNPWHPDKLCPASFYSHLGSKLNPHLRFVTLVIFCKSAKSCESKV